MSGKDKNLKIKLAALVSESERIIAELEDVIAKNLPQRGDSSESCQNVNISNILNELESAINSIEINDLKQDPDWEYQNRVDGFIASDTYQH